MIIHQPDIFPVLLLIIAVGIAVAAVLYVETASGRRSRFRALDSRPMPTEHDCRLPWWRPFRKLGTRIQCVQCNTTWRWDRYEWAPGDSSLIWINEQEEAEQAEIAEQAKRNAH
jgi:hypothetical protein